MTATHYSELALETSPIIPKGESINPAVIIGPGAVRHQAIVDTTSSDPLTTLQTTSGRPTDAFSARPTDLITVFGMQTTVAAALLNGAIVRHPATGALMAAGKTREEYLGVGPGASPAHQAQQEQQTQDAPLSRAATTFQSVLRDRVPGTELAGAYADYLNQGTLSDLTVNRIASHLMITPEQARENLGAYADALEDQRARSMARFGIDDLEQFDAWAKQAKPDLLHKARTLHLTGGSMEGYRGLAQIYFENLDAIDPERILTANFGSGITARMSGGKVLLKVPGMGEWPWRNAVSQGIVRLR